MREDADPQLVRPRWKQARCPARDESACAAYKFGRTACLVRTREAHNPADLRKLQGRTPPKLLIGRPARVLGRRLAWRGLRSRPAGEAKGIKDRRWLMTNAPIARSSRAVAAGRSAAQRD